MTNDSIYNEREDDGVLDFSPVTADDTANESNSNDIASPSDTDGLSTSQVLEETDPTQLERARLFFRIANITSADPYLGN
ncbi:MAG: hypothetical protein K2Z81_24580, partial [Cyanobacteria bacterium]|nr:hypothetical protein [Cyanobacteriota bacterium]